MINKFKIILDILMTILMVLLMKIDVIALQVHEVIGITIFILFLVHKIVNYKFVKAIGKNIFSKKLKLNSKIMFILDIVLLCFMLANVLTGILISKFILTELMAKNVEFITILHKFFAWWTLILISIHIGLHLDRLVNYFTRKCKFLKDNVIIKVIILIMYLVFAILGIRSLCKYSIYSKIILIDNNTNQTLQERKYQDKVTNQEEYQKEATNSGEESNVNDDTIFENEKIPTLEEYLSQFKCGGCRKNCSLLYPICEIGKKKREEKTKEYYEIYVNQKEENNNSSNNETKNNELISEIHNAEQKEEKNDNDRKYRNKSNVLDVINIIFLFIGGTYYLNALFRKKENI